MRVVGATAGRTQSPGEQAVVAALAGALDDAHTLFCGARPTPAADPVDLVLVGPAGVVVMTIHEYTGAYAADGEQWFYSLDGGQSWRSGLENPIRQALHDRDQIQAYLDQAGARHAPMEPVVVCPNAQTRVAAKDPAARLVRRSELESFARALAGRALLTPTRVQAIVTALQQTVTPAARPASSPPPTTPRPAPARRASRASRPWLIALGVLLACNGGVCCGFILVWLLKNPL